MSSALNRVSDLTSHPQFRIVPDRGPRTPGSLGPLDPTDSPATVGVAECGVVGVLEACLTAVRTPRLCRGRWAPSPVRPSSPWPTSRPAGTSSTHPPPGTFLLSQVSGDFVLYCIVLYCIVLYCIVLYCIALHCIALYCFVLYFIVLHCITLYCTYIIVLYLFVFY